MASILSHFLVGAGLYRFVDARRSTGLGGALFAGAMAMLPDADSLAMPWAPYGSAWGHRGMTHSLAFATVAGMLSVFALRRRAAFPGGALACAATLAVVVASHGFLDAMTDGGLGVAFFAPFDSTRYFLPWRPIPVSPITLNAFDPHVWRVISAETLLLWPAALMLWTARRPMAWPWRAAIVASLLVSAGVWGSRL
jgi:inner membrane protein